MNEKVVNFIILEVIIKSNYLCKIYVKDVFEIFFINIEKCIIHKTCSGINTTHLKSYYVFIITIEAKKNIGDQKLHLGFVNMYFEVK